MLPVLSNSREHQAAEWGSTGIPGVTSRLIFFLRNSIMDYIPETLEQYLEELDERFPAGSMPETGYYMHRKAALIIREIAETGQFQWKRSPRKAVLPLESSELENIRQQYLLFLQNSNYSEGAIRSRDYIFRNIASKNTLTLHVCDNITQS